MKFQVIGISILKKKNVHQITTKKKNLYTIYDLIIFDIFISIN